MKQRDRMSQTATPAAPDSPARRLDAATVLGRVTTCSRAIRHGGNGPWPLAHRLSWSGVGPIKVTKLRAHVTAASPAPRVALSKIGS